MSNRQSYCFTGVWNAREARFEHCFVPVIVAVPAIIAAILLLALVLLLLVGGHPAWLEPFVAEPQYGLGEGDPRPRRRGLLWIPLTVASLVCLGLQLPDVVNTRGAVESLPPAIVWLVALGMAGVLRPRTTSFALLALFGLQAVVDAVRLVDILEHGNGIKDGKLILATIIVETIGIILILLMPLRDPNQPAIDISKPPGIPSSALRSPEDNLTLLQFMTVSWMKPMIDIGYKRQLQDEDVWQLPYEFHHQRLHDNFRVLKGTVVQRLIKANIIDLIILSALGLLELVMQYSGPLLLQQLLASMEDLRPAWKVAIVYAVLICGVRLVTAQSGVFSLWYGRRCYERSRGEMITMLYEKALNRKIGFKEDEKEEEPTSNGASNGHSNGHIPNGDIAKGEPIRWWQSFAAQIAKLIKRKKNVPPPAKTPATMGKILNLMRNDVYEVAQRFWEFQGLIQKPLSVVFSVTLVVRLLGWSSLLAVAMIIVAQCIIAVLARIMVYYEKKRRTETDTKLQVTSQWIEAIRHLRWYGWQDSWLSQIMEARQRELNLRIVTSLWNLVIATFNSLALDLTPVVCFFAYTVLSGKPLRVDIAFPAMQLFSMLTGSLRDLPNLIIVLVNAWVAVGRIEDYMAEPDRVEQEEPSAVQGVDVRRARFAWPGSLSPVFNIDAYFPFGLHVVCGEVGSGKTALLQAILGELDLLDGLLSKKNNPIAYCAQTPWLQSMSIRDNILFGEEYEKHRYWDVVRACALEPDLREFKNGDRSMIGENGVGLSGGQRARVALARAMYSQATMFLFDDPLASLDQETAQHIANEICYGERFRNKTVILATHRTDLIAGATKSIFQMEGGVCRKLQEDEFPDHFLDSRNRAKTLDSTDSNDEEQKRKGDVMADKFMEDEHRAHGGVKASVYWEYIKAGNLWFWAMLIPLLVLYRTLAIGMTWMLKNWGEAYNRHTTPAFLFQQPDVVHIQSSFPDNWPSPDVDVRPWLIAFSLLSVGQSVAFILSQGMTVIIVYTAGKNMFRAIMDKVAGANFRFYDITPVGRLMNRMTSDITVIDGNISAQFQSVAWLSISWVGSIVVIASVTPVFLIFAMALTALFVGIFLLFIPTSQSLRRLEMVSLTPLMSNFGALLEGLTTVRAFRVQSQFQARVVHVVDTFQKMDHFYWSLQAWLMYRYDLLSAISTLCLTCLALYTHTSAGLTAFVLIAANKLVSSTHALCKQYGQLQMNFVSVERIVELLHLPQEPAGTISPPAHWPSPTGPIIFTNVTLKYAPHMSPALTNLSLTLPGGTKTVIVGRTGSGKSTLALSLLATTLPTSGTITIDGIDISRVDRHALRSRITFLAQDPVLFPGSMRKNLDPLDVYSDEECASVLDKVCSDQSFSLSTPIEAGGKNLSQGQRQLVALARAVLRRSSIVILDEATASIDFATSRRIQAVLERELAGCTVVAIAHRVEVVRGAERGVLLRKGRVVRVVGAEGLEGLGREEEEEVEGEGEGEEEVAIGERDGEEGQGGDVHGPVL